MTDTRFQDNPLPSPLKESDLRQLENDVQKFEEAVIIGVAGGRGRGSTGDPKNPRLAEDQKPNRIGFVLNRIDHL